MRASGIGSATEQHQSFRKRARRPRAATYLCRNDARTELDQYYRSLRASRTSIRVAPDLRKTSARTVPERHQNRPTVAPGQHQRSSRASPGQSHSGTQLQGSAGATPEHYESAAEYQTVGPEQHRSSTELALVQHQSKPKGAPAHRTNETRAAPDNRAALEHQESSARTLPEQRQSSTWMAPKQHRTKLIALKKTTRAAPVRRHTFDSPPSSEFDAHRVGLASRPTS